LSGVKGEEASKLLFIYGNVEEVEKSKERNY